MIEEQDLCALATQGERLLCSLMCYATSEDCRELYMVTHGETQKCRNMRANPEVCLLIDERAAHQGGSLLQSRAMTVHGVFEELEGTRRGYARTRLLGRHPYLEELAASPGAVFFSVRLRSVHLLRGTGTKGFVTLD